MSSEKDPYLQSALDSLQTTLPDYDDFIPEEDLQVQEKPDKKRGFSRLKGKFGNAAFALLMTGALTPTAIDIGMHGVRVVQAYEENQSDKDDSSLSVEDFISKNKDKLDDIEFGCSFAPEMYGLSPENYKSKWGQKQMKQMLSDLKFIHEDLKINVIRIGIRWNNVVDKNGKFDMSFYMPMLKFLFQSDENLKSNGGQADKNENDKIQVIMDIGGKVMRWPEQDEPPQYETEVEYISTHGGVVHANTPFSNAMVDYETKVLKDVQSKFTPEELKHLTAIQFNNEGDNDFGLNPVRFDEQVQIQSVDNAIKIFPDVEYDFNSAGSLNVDEELKLLGDLRAKYTNAKLGIGFDNYPIDVGDQDAPLIGEVNPEEIPFFGHIDPEFADKASFDKFGKAADQCVQEDLNRLVMEMQAEPWDEKPQLPGNPVYDFQYSTLRSIRILNPDKVQSNKNKFKVLVWGIEKMVQNRDDSSNQQIFQMIRYVNYGENPINLGTYNVGGELVTLVEFQKPVKTA